MATRHGYPDDTEIDLIDGSVQRTAIIPKDTGEGIGDANGEGIAQTMACRIQRPIEFALCLHIAGQEGKDEQRKEAFHDGGPPGYGSHYVS
jgi:hypothetical protein